MCAYICVYVCAIYMPVCLYIYIYIPFSGNKSGWDRTHTMFTNSLSLLKFHLHEG